MTNTRKKDECQKASFFFSFFQISDKLFSLRVPFTEPWSSARCLNPHLNCKLSSWVGVWKCIFRVSVFMLILARAPSLPNVHKAPGLSPALDCTAGLRGWETHRLCEGELCFTYGIRKGLLSSRISKETLKIWIEIGLDSEAKGTKRIASVLWEWRRP